MKALKNAGIATIVLCGLGLIGMIIGMIVVFPNIENPEDINLAMKKLLNPLWIIPMSIIGLILTYLMFNGYFYLGKKLKNKFLVVISWIFFAIFAINSIYSNISYITRDNLIEPNTTSLVMGVIFLGLFAIIMVLQGIALLLFKERVEYAKPTGILMIISGGLFMTFIGAMFGAFTYIAAIILQIIMFLKNSKKYDER